MTKLQVSENVQHLLFSKKREVCGLQVHIQDEYLVHKDDGEQAHLPVVTVISKILNLY